LVFQAVIKNGGLFIPHIDPRLLEQSRISIVLEIKKQQGHKKNIVAKTAGMLKGKVVDGLDYQHKLREEWK